MDIHPILSEFGELDRLDAAIAALERIGARRRGDESG